MSNKMFLTTQPKVNIPNVSVPNISGVKGIRQTRIDAVIECLGRDFDIESLRKSEILKEDEIELFERNIKLMKLDEIMNHPSEIEWYEECIAKTVNANKDEFKSLIKKLELWNIYRKLNEWYSAFQKKSNGLSSIYTNDYFDIFQYT